MKTKFTLVVSFVIEGDEDDAIESATNIGEYLLTVEHADQWLLQDINSDLCWRDRK